MAAWLSELCSTVCILSAASGDARAEALGLVPDSPNSSSAEGSCSSLATMFSSSLVSGTQG